MLVCACILPHVFFMHVYVHEGMWGGLHMHVPKFVLGTGESAWILHMRGQAMCMQTYSDIRVLCVCSLHICRLSRRSHCSEVEGARADHMDKTVVLSERGSSPGVHGHMFWRNERHGETWCEATWSCVLTWSTGKERRPEGMCPDVPGRSQRCNIGFQICTQILLQW